MINNSAINRVIVVIIFIIFKRFHVLISNMKFIVFIINSKVVIIVIKLICLLLFLYIEQPLKIQNNLY